MFRHYTSLISILFGKFANTKFPTPVQNFINSAYVKLMGLDMNKFEQPSHYANLNLLFTRALKSLPDFTKMDKESIISPVDALVTDFGKITDGYAYQIKGMRYSVQELLDTDYEESLIDGDFINFYLSPKDYHRYHIPCDLQILSASHIPGKLYPVNMPLLKNMPNLFIENERVILKCKTKQGKFFFLVLVGALNVGVMKLSFDDRVQTNVKVDNITRYQYDNLFLDRGELFGWFEMGSTIVLLAQKGSIKSLNLEVGKKVSFGEIIGRDNG